MPRAQARASKKSIYGIHPMVDHARSILAKMEQTTGKSLDQWIAIAKKGPMDDKEREAWLKAEHGQSNYTARWLADFAVGRGFDLIDDDAHLALAEQQVIDQYAGKKAHLKPIYDTLLALGRALGNDVKACPCKTMVPFYRAHVFAQVKPTTNSRVDLGLALDDLEPTGLLIDTGGLAKKDRITRRIPLETVSDINAEVKKWLKKAYALDK